jgi:hypothetical protein
MMILFSRHVNIKAIIIASPYCPGVAEWVAAALKYAKYAMVGATRVPE